MCRLTPSGQCESWRLNQIIKEISSFAFFFTTVIIDSWVWISLPTKCHSWLIPQCTWLTVCCQFTGPLLCVNLTIANDLQLPMAAGFVFQMDPYHNITVQVQWSFHFTLSRPSPFISVQFMCKTVYVFWSQSTLYEWEKGSRPIVWSFFSCFGLVE